MAVMHGEYKVPGGKLVVVALRVDDGHIATAQVSGDFFLEPDTALDSINAALLGMPADAGEAMIAASVRMALGPGVALFGITPEGVAVAVRRALGGHGHGDTACQIGRASYRESVGQSS